MRFEIRERKEPWVGTFWEVYDAMLGESVMSYLDEREDAQHIADALDRYVSSGKELKELNAAQPSGSDPTLLSPP